MSSAMNPVMKIDFEDLFPVDLSGFTMDSRDTDIAYVEATATFKFKKYSFTPM
jgi:hypothetical protein